MTEPVVTLKKETWLILLLALSLLSIFSAGFDSDIVYVALFFLAIALIILNRNIKWHKALLLYGAFMIWSGVSLFWSIAPNRTIIEWVQLSVYGFSFLIALNLDDEDAEKFISILFVLGVAITSFGILEFLFVKDARMVATFSNPNPFGIYMTMLFSIVLGKVVRRSSANAMALSIIFLIAVLLSGSRASLGALIVGNCFNYFKLTGDQKKKAVIKTVIIAISALGISQMILYLAPFIQDRIFLDQSIFERVTRSNSFVTTSLKGRMEFWRVALKLFENRPLTGYGLGTYFSGYYIEYGMNAWYSRFAHNHYLQIMAELGVVGIFLFLGFLFLSIKSVVLSLSKTENSFYAWGMLSAIVAFLLHIGVDFTWNFPAVTSLFFVLLGLMMRKQSKESTQGHKTGIYIAIVGILVIGLWQYGASRLYVEALRINQSGDRESALKVTEWVNKIYPFSAFGFSYEGELLWDQYLETGDEASKTQAIAITKRAVSVMPYSSEMYEKLGRLYQQVGAYDLAEENYKFSIQYGAYTLDGSFNLSQLYLNLGKTQEATQVLLDALERAPYAIGRAPKSEIEKVVDNVAQLHITLALIYKQDGNQEDFNKQVEAVFELKKEYPFLEKYFN